MAITLIAAATPASAQWLSASGRISTVVLSQADNFSFRIHLQDPSGGQDPLAQCSHNFAFINTSDSNYQAKVATLLSAASQRQTVNISYVKEADNWCRMLDFWLSY